MLYLRDRWSWDFFRFIDKTEWPVNMYTLRENLLRETSFDEEVRKNNGNDDIVLPSLLESFRRLFPIIVDEQDERDHNAKHALNGVHDVGSTKSSNLRTVQIKTSSSDNYDINWSSNDDAFERFKEYRSIMYIGEVANMGVDLKRLKIGREKIL